jgi:hypothetical protein
VVDACTGGPRPAYTESDCLCRRRSWLGTVTAAAGTPVVGALGRRLRAGWVVPASAATSAVLSTAQGPLGHRIRGIGGRTRARRSSGASTAWPAGSACGARAVSLRTHPPNAEQIARVRSADRNPDRRRSTSPLG